MVHTPRASNWNSTYYAALCEKLAFPPWNTESNLWKEMSEGLPLMISRHGISRVVSSYVFQGLLSIIKSGLLPSICDRPLWISSILRLPIFPVGNKDGLIKFCALKEGLHVPDSKEIYKLCNNTIEFLDFGNDLISEIVPLLRCIDVGLNYMSHYIISDFTTLHISHLYAKTLR